MSELDNQQADGVFRKPSLIAGMTRKMALTYVGGAVCAAAVVIIDSLIAGVSIGADALAAIAAAAPLLSLGQILHCMLGFGIDKLMVQAIGEGKRNEANRIFGAVLAAVLVVYVVVYALLLWFERPILQLIVDDAALFDLMIRYTQPLFVASPIFEVLLCTERAFRIDGKAQLFSLRGIITNIANIAFDLVLVSFLGLGIAGLAWASVISTLLGHVVTISHVFSKKRTVSPDFSVVFVPHELLSYVKQDMRLGSAATLDEVMSTLALSLQTMAVGAAGGSAGLAIWAVYKSMRGVVIAAGNGVSASVSVHVGLRYGEDDYNGSRYAVKEGMRIALWISVAALLLVLVLAQPICVAYGIATDLQPLGANCLRIGCLLFPTIGFFAVLTAYLPAVDQVKLTSRFVLIQYALLIIAAAIGYAVGLQGFFVCYVVSSWVAALVFGVLLRRDRYWFIPQHNPEEIACYSIEVVPDQIFAMSDDANKRMRKRVHLGSLRFVGNPMADKVGAFCTSVALVVEDAVSYIAQNNPDAVVSADVLIKQNERAILIVIVDNGVPCNPLARPADADLSEPGILEAVVVLGLATEVRYDRVLELNHMKLLVKPHVRPPADGS